MCRVFNIEDLKE